MSIPFWMLLTNKRISISQFHLEAFRLVFQGGGIVLRLHLAQESDL